MSGEPVERAELIAGDRVTLSQGKVVWTVYVDTSYGLMGRAPSGMTRQITRRHHIRRLV